MKKTFKSFKTSKTFYVCNIKKFSKLNSAGHCTLFLNFVFALSY